MSAASLIATKPSGTGPFAKIAARPLAVALLILALLTAARVSGRVDSDVAWQLWIAERIHAGANLYTDIVETNPPLWFWMAVPVERLAALLDLRIESLLVLAIGFITALSLAATDRLACHIGPVRRSLLLVYSAIILAAMPWMHVGQREQIVLIATLPYAALIASRREDRSVSALTAASIGAGAALGFALKQYFLLVPAMLELWLLAGQRRGWRALRPETLALVALGVSYAAAIAFIEPDFVGRIVPLIRLAYGVFGAPGIQYLFGPFAIVGLLLLGALSLRARVLGGRTTPIASAMTVAAIAFALVYFVQFKGWPYHAIPLIGCASIALASLLAEHKQMPPWLRVFAPALLLLPLVLSAEEELNPALPSPDLLNAVSGLRPGDSVGFLTTETAIPWSVTLQGHYRYASRYNGFWMMRAIIRNEQARSPDPRLTALGRQIVSETVSDFACIPPQRIIVTRPRPGESTFDTLPFFLRDQSFASLLSHYRVRSRTSLETYELASPFPSASSGCRNGV
jgi:hypothetical protein